ncbi:heme lyase CcmF/NrfE family subunit [Effusibacillus lacus]|uniref:Cytochrome C biogenesis protein n=1 Tax=Effusibacillus lacus TaxID=1348429 RepID=A0A292YSB4_9BACL|nr:heme lyase CcmF/NrfE family subunit [Effusibacillus lacus]TCS76114.1 cytochrome c-type biogenesis protein CcmF [Effusibacillus lacus]GAX91375.1 cytochrome C biogenesis protein [Effusibacillus lacus]
MALLGNSAIYLGLALSIYSLVIMLIGVKKQNQQLVDSGKGAILSVFLVTAISMALLLYLLGTSQFQFEYVKNYTSTELPLVYKLAALWAGNAGSLLLWTFFLALYNVMIMNSRMLRGNPMVPYVGMILTANTVFFMFILAFVAKPFVLLDEVPLEGNGLNPMLQNPGMMLHPVTLYLGYVGLSVPFAFAMAALLLKNIDDFWIKVTRRWTIVAWLFLTLGNLLGAQWAYVELGWGGYWAWDPVENASFMPWLTATAFLHSVMIQERKNMLKVWNVSLIIISYALTLFGTFLVRSGVLTSVHAFSNSNLGTYFLLYMGIAVIGGLYVLMSRYHLLRRDSGQFESLLSKESSFLLNNLILVGAAFSVFWGTNFPLISEAVRGTKVTVGAPFFNQVNAPIMLALLFVMAVCPLIAWQRSSLKNFRDNFLIPLALTVVLFLALVAMGMTKIWALVSFSVVGFLFLTHIQEFYRGIRARRKMTQETVPVAAWRLMIRNKRRYGGYIVHFGIAMIAIGIIGSNNFESDLAKTVKQGETIEIAGYTLTYESLAQRSEGINDIVFADLAVSKNGQAVGVIRAEKVFYGNWPEPSTEVGLISTFKEDLYVALSAWEPDGRATFSIKVNPLVKWIWTGGIIVVIGSLFAIWKGRFGNVVPKYTGVERKVS